MKLTKRIQARTKTIHYNWCKKDFLVFNASYREIRKRIRGETKHCCKWCNKPFVDGEMMALAQPQKGKNHLLCQKCADILLSS